MTNRNRIVFLDTLRIFAFSSVIIGHRYYDNLLAYSQQDTTAPVLHWFLVLVLPLFYCGAAGVIVFFFVSGYIITHVLQNESTTEFLIKRLFRIYPLYMTAVLLQNSRSLLLCLLIPHLLPERIPILLSQLFLIGDFTGTQYSLYGIEWTLRIEVLFYLYMALLHALKLLHTFKKFLPYILIATTLVLAVLPPFPTWNETTLGDLTIYAPFLLLGSMIYLTEKKQANTFHLPVFIAIVFAQYYAMVAAYQPRWSGFYFAQLAFMLFILAWIFRRQIVAPDWVLRLSDLTYAAYLFHSWHFKYIKDMLIQNSVTFLPPELLAMILFLLLCVLAVKYIEKPCIRLGQRLVRKYFHPTTQHATTV